jgi:large subunit ribosomal protein L17
MRHRKKIAKLGRTYTHRAAMLKNLATSVILHEKIKTTPQKAKAVRGIIEHYINIGKSKEHYQIKRLYNFFANPNAAKKIIQDIAPAFENKNSGFVRIIRTQNRCGDNAPQVILELMIPHKAVIEKATKVTVTKKKAEKPKEEGAEKTSWIDKVKNVPKRFQSKEGAKDVTIKRTTSK